MESARLKDKKALLHAIFDPDREDAIKSISWKKDVVFLLLKLEATNWLADHGAETHLGTVVCHQTYSNVGINTKNSCM